MAEAGEALTSMEVKVGPTGGVIQVRALRVRVAPVEPEDSQYVDERRIEIPRGQRERLVSTVARFAQNAK
jgi:hypothetical protein